MRRESRSYMESGVEVISRTPYPYGECVYCWMVGDQKHSRRYFRFLDGSTLELGSKACPDPGDIPRNWFSVQPTCESES